MGSKKDKRFNIKRPIYIDGEFLDIEIKAFNNVSEQELNFYIECMKKTVHVVNSLEFKILVTNERRMINTNGNSPLQIYEQFMSGSDPYNPIEDQDIDIAVTLYYKNNRVIGYTYPNTFRTWLNRKFFAIRASRIPTICGNVVHEYMHNLGYTHKRRNYSMLSVPYFYGNATSKLVYDVIHGRELTRIEKSSFLKRRSLGIDSRNGQTQISEENPRCSSHKG